MERFILQPADRKEAEKAMALIDEAKEFLKSQGIDQWQTGYPDMETIIGDLAHGRGYFIGEGSSAAAFMRHVFEKNGFDYCGTIWFDNSVKYAYEKMLKRDAGVNGAV